MQLTMLSYCAVAGRPALASINAALIQRSSEPRD